MGNHAWLAGFVPQQKHFDFLSTDHVLSLTALNEQRQSRIQQARERKLTNPRPIRFLKPADFIDQIPLDLLQAPLADVVGDQSVSHVFLEMMEDHGDVLATEADDTLEASGESDSWSDEAVAQLHEGLLYSSLAVLAGKGNATEKVEALKWFYLPDIYCWNRRANFQGEPVFKPIYARHIPFTFQRCSALVGINVEDLRGRLSTILRKAGLGQYLPLEEK